ELLLLRSGGLAVVVDDDAPGILADDLLPGDGGPPLLEASEDVGAAAEGDQGGRRGQARRGERRGLAAVVDEHRDGLELADPGARGRDLAVHGRDDPPGSCPDVEDLAEVAQ